MLIAVATDTIATQSQKRSLQVLLSLLKKRLILNVSRFMAGTAVQLGVFALQGKSGLPVIEILLSTFPIDQVKIPAVMFHMAVLALAEFRIGMEPLIVLDALLQNAMAGETFGRGDLFAHIVALGAVLQSLQFSVGLMQITGRQLRIQRMDAAQRSRKPY